MKKLRKLNKKINESLPVVADFKINTKSIIVKKAESPLLNTLEKEFENCKRVLEVGSGIHSPMGKISRNFYLEGIDMLPINKNKKMWLHDNYKKGNIKNLRKYYKKNSFDGVVALDVIEHLTKEDGLKLISDIDYIAKKKIVILTPEGFHKQGTIDGNIYMTHLSGWKVNEFKKYGYKTHGMHGLKILRGKEASMKYKPWYFWLLISDLSQYITYFIPRIAFHIIAIKTK